MVTKNIKKILLNKDGNKFVVDTENVVRSVNGTNADINGNVSITSVANATNANHANSADSATNATKATQDSAGQQINTTYVKDVTASNATITVTKGNGTTSTATINNVANADNATNADKLDGLHANASVGANTVVARDSNGYVNFNYINSNTNNNENPTISQIIVTNGEDNYYRKASLAHLKNSLGIASSSGITKLSTRNTTGTWTITNVSTSKPLFIFFSRVSEGRYVGIQVISGVLGIGDAAYNDSNSIVLKPTSTTVSLNIIARPPFRDYLEAWQ